MGRTGKPADINDGNPRKRNPAKKPAVDLAVGPEARRATPAELSKDGKAFWQKMFPILAPMQFVREQDREALIRYCEHAGEWWKLTRDIRREGYTYDVQSNHGAYKRANPKVAIRDRIEGQLTAIEDRFGLNPLARQRMLAQLANMNALHPGEGLFGWREARATSADSDSVQAPTNEQPTSSDAVIGFLN